jgi:hypothetical protein
MNEKQADLVKRLRALAASRKIVDATTAALCEAANEISGEHEPVPMVDVTPKPRESHMLKFFGRK